MGSASSEAMQLQQKDRSGGPLPATAAPPKIRTSANRDAVSSAFRVEPETGVFRERSINDAVVVEGNDRVAHSQPLFGHEVHQRPVERRLKDAGQPRGPPETRRSELFAPGGCGRPLRWAGNRRAFACRDRAGGLREAGGREVLGG